MSDYDPVWLKSAQVEIRKALKKPIDQFDYFKEVADYSSYDKFVQVVRKGVYSDTSLITDLEKRIASESEIHFTIETFLIDPINVKDEKERYSNFGMGIFFGEEYYKKNPADAVGPKYLSQIYLKNPTDKDAALGINLLRKAIDLQPNNFTLYEELLSRLDKFGMIGDSIGLLGTIIEKKPDSSFAYFYRGLVFKNASQFQKAIPDFMKSYELNPNNAAALEMAEKCL